MLILIQEKFILYKCQVEKKCTKGFTSSHPLQSQMKVILSYIKYWQIFHKKNS